MIYRFGNFELDQRRMELRLCGKALELQPLVFQLISLLVKNRDRVIPKNELLDTLWADSLVTESSLQRAVSLARAALRKGKMESALKNIPRMGYRFVAEVEEDTGTVANEPAPTPALQLEQQADAEKWDGNLSGAAALLEQAIELHRGAGDNRSAARVAVRLARVQNERRESAVAAGWLALAANLLGDDREGAEHGYRIWMQAELAHGAKDDAAALAHCDEAYEVSRRINDPGLEALSLATRGHVLMGMGEYASAAGCHQEAGALVLAGGVKPEDGGWVLCSIITSAFNRGDCLTADQWTGHFTRWCDRHGKSAYPGMCVLHRAELTTLKGKLPQALEQAESACRMLHDAVPWAEGSGYRVLGDVLFAQGDLAAAEEAYTKAYTLGWEPQPGLAWVYMARGNPESALASLQRTIASGNWFSRERTVLLTANLAMVAVEAGDTPLARRTLKQLESLARTELPLHRALLARTRARLAAHSGKPDEALAQLQQARREWQAVGATLDAASEHLEAARILCAMGDAAAAALELSAATEACRTAGAEGLLQRCEDLRRQWQVA